MTMDKIETELILNAGAKYVTSNHPDALAKRIVLAQLLVDARYSTELESAFLAFRTWSSPKTHGFSADKILTLCNEEWDKRKRAIR